MSNPGSPLVSVSQMAAQMSTSPGALPPTGGARNAGAGLVSVSDIAKNGIPEPTEEEKFLNSDPRYRAFLKANPTYKYLPTDPRFPNRQPGIYPMGPENAWRNDPNAPNSQTSQFPIDLDFAKNTAEYGLGSAALVGGGAAMAEAIPAVLPTTIAGVRAIGEWADKHPMHAYMLYQVIREFLPGAKKAIGIVKGAPE